MRVLCALKLITNQLDILRIDSYNKKDFLICYQVSQKTEDHHKASTFCGLLPRNKRNTTEFAIHDTSNENYFISREVIQPILSIY